MKYLCPECSATFLPEDINVQTDIALCKGCGQISRLSELIDDEIPAVDLQNPPKGAWYQKTLSEVVIGATTRNASAFMLVPFTLVWAGGSMGGIYGSQIITGKFNLMMSIFGLPFLVGSIMLVSTTLMACCGKLEVNLRGRQGTVFVGVGRLGWRRPINLDEVETITSEATSFRYPGGTGIGIVLQGKSLLRFATNLSETRHYFVLNALRQIHARKR